MRIKKPLLYAILASVTLHIVFFVSAAVVKIPGVYAALERSERIFNIKALEEKLPERRTVTKPVEYSETLKFESPVYSAGLQESIDRIAEPKKDTLEPRDEKIDETVPPELKEEEDLVKEEEERRIVREPSRRDTKEGLVDAVRISEEGMMAGGEEAGKASELPSDFFDTMPGFTPEMTGGFFENIKERVVSQVAKVYAPAIKRETDYADADKFLICGLSTYEDPDDGKKYFKITIRAGEKANDLKEHQKEMVFLVDCSLSIKKEKLEEFKKGLKHALTHLNPGDHFNIMAFKEENVWFSPRSVTSTKKTVNDALSFVDGLTAGQKTDVYSALYTATEVPTTVIPSYIILFSDGQPTRGETDPGKIISRISSINRGKKPIFAFGGGREANRYLLDFISYKNRGWTEYSLENRYIGKNVARMYEKIKDPLFLDLRYRMSGLETSELFPKTLPDFFRHAEFTLYGTYTDEDEISFQLLGSSNGSTHEFIVTGSLKEAAKGGREIARNWAFNKIYYLISQIEYGKVRQSILDEMYTLSRKFDIKTPYTEGIMIKIRDRSQRR